MLFGGYKFRYQFQTYIGYCLFLNIGARKSVALLGKAAEGAALGIERRNDAAFSVVEWACDALDDWVDE